MDPWDLVWVSIHIDVPNSHWLVDENRGFFNETPEKQQVSMMIDGINQLPAQTYFYQKDSIVNTIPWSSMTWMIWGYY